jgi:CRISPR-associated protein (TIGR02710 family)
MRALDKKEFPKESIIVDYTGGTKPMSAALCLATVNFGLQFSYVSGKERNKGGLGTVVSGTEEVKKGLSPWQVLLVEEKQRFAQHFNSYQFDAALSMAKDISSHPIEKNELNLFEILAKTTEAYRAWDNFDHGRCLQLLTMAAPDFKRYIKYASAEYLAGFQQALSANIAFLSRFSKATDNFAKMHPIYVQDLVANARRRAEVGKFDDAVARLYRAVEMIGQIEFEKKFGCTTSDVDIAKLPEQCRERLTTKQRTAEQKKRKIELPLVSTFSVLKEVGNPKAKILFDHYDDFKALLHARNYSVLAHGIIPVKEGTCKKFSRFVVEKFDIDDTLEFPKLEL